MDQKGQRWLMGTPQPCHLVSMGRPLMPPPGPPQPPSARPPPLLAAREDSVPLRDRVIPPEPWKTPLTWRRGPGTNMGAGVRPQADRWITEVWGVA